MSSLQRFVLTSLAAFGLLAGAIQPAHGGPIGVGASTTYPLPSYDDPDARVVAFFVAIYVEEGWYFDGMEFTGLATREGRALPWDSVPNRELWFQLFELSITNYGGGAEGYFGEAIINSATRPGVYDRNPLNLKALSGITVYAHNDEGETATDWAPLSFQVPGRIVPEPTSALLLGVGLAIPAGAVWLRRRRAA